MDTIRIGAVNYLNTKPLVHELEELAPEAELLLDVPSRLADLLAEGALEVALIPVIEYFRGGRYRVVPDIAIASSGPVLSVTLFSRVPWQGIRREAPRLGLDAGFCRRYLSNIIRFDLGPREQAGLHHYYMLACEMGLARKGVNLEFYNRAAVLTP